LSCSSQVVDKWCGKLGGERLFELGDGDDDANLEEDFDTWKSQMWEVLGEKLMEG